MKKKQIAFLLVFILVNLFSCNKQGDKWNGTIEELDGVTVVKNPSKPIYGENVLTLEEELMIGESGKEEVPVFISISSIQVDSRGNIYVLDGRVRQIKVFDKEGRLTHSFGREGQGPGEFQATNDMVLTSNENLEEFTFQALSCDEQGRIFVRTSEQTVDSKGHYYDIFDEEGRYMAKIPLGFFPRTWKDNKLYSIEEDEEGYQVVKRYKITWNY